MLDNKRCPINSKERQSRIIGKATNELYPYYGATGQVGFIDEYKIDGEYLLVGEDGAPFLDKYASKAYLIQGKSWVNNHAHILKPMINQSYMLYVLNAISYKPYVNGTTRLKLTQEALRRISVPVPPIKEQERIAEKVFTLFSQIDALLEFL